MPLYTSCWLKLMQNFHLQFFTAISTCVALTLWYWSIQPNESTVKWWFNEKDGIRSITCTLNTSHRLTNQGIQLFAANLITDGTVTDKQCLPILGLWVFLFWTWQEHLWRAINAGKHLFRIYWRDWHEPITLKLNIYHFLPPNFGSPPNN